MTSITEFEYYLPKKLIAQHPAEPRESARMMVLHKNTQTFIHSNVSDLPSLFYPGDVVVLNNTKVFKARLQTILNQKPVEIFLIKPIGNNWLCLAKPAKKLKIGTNVTIAENFIGTLTEKQIDGSILIAFPYSTDDVIAKANQYGSIPLPPYIKEEAKEAEYQTSYAKEVGSVAAPTAGFHLTEKIRQQMKDKGVIFTEVTLHVGMGTFMPVKTDQIEDHTMHSEWVHLSQESCDLINLAKEEGRRVIAIGTTTVRTLEGCALQGGALPYRKASPSVLQPFIGDINLFITPGFEFKIIDGLLTNFHLPKSTLLMLVSAFAGKKLIFDAYKEAVKQNYRFFSFGDCMLIL